MRRGGVASRGCRSGPHRAGDSPRARGAGLPRPRRAYGDRHRPGPVEDRAVRELEGLATFQGSPQRSERAEQSWPPVTRPDLFFASWNFRRRLRVEYWTEGRMAMRTGLLTTTLGVMTLAAVLAAAQAGVKTPTPASIPGPWGTDPGGGSSADGAVPGRQGCPRRRLLPQSLQSVRHGDDDGETGIARVDGHPLLPPRPPRRYRAAEPSCQRTGAHRFPQAEHPHLRAPAERRVRARRRSRTWSSPRPGTGPSCRSADVPRRAVRDNVEGRSSDADRRSPQVRAAVPMVACRSIATIANGMFAQFNPAVSCANHRGPQTHTGHSGH